MAEQQNYQSNLQELSDAYTRYTVSRIIANKKDDLLDMEVPADFSEALLQNNVEINLYSLSDNSIIFSDVVRNVSGSIFTETLQYNDNSLRKLLYIDFAKVPGLDLPSGQYSVTLNFFAIGINTIMQNVLDDAYPIALQTVEDMVLLSGSTSFTETELSEYVVNAIDIAYDAALNDEAQNPQNYRFDLI